MGDVWGQVTVTMHLIQLCAFYVEHDLDISVGITKRCECLCACVHMRVCVFVCVDTCICVCVCVYVCSVTEISK